MNKYLIFGIALLSIFMTIILIFFFLFSKKGDRTQNRILAALLIVFSFQIFISFALGNYGYQYFVKANLYIYALKLASFASGPLIYYYIRYFTAKNKTVKFNIAHFIPFFCSLAIFTYFKFDIAFIRSMNQIIIVLILIHNLIYIISSIYYLKKSNITLNSFLRNFQDFSFYTWIQIILLGYIVIWIVQLNSLSIYVILRQPNWCAYTGSILALVILIFTILVMFLLLLKPEIYYAIKYKNNYLNESSKSEYLQRLNNYMEAEKPYLIPDISLEVVARNVSINPRLLSQIINESFKTNFKSYINNFRIREFMRILSDDSSVDKTIQEIYYMVGFNSRSVFYDLFKKQTGLSPKEFKEKKSIR